MRRLLWLGVCACAGFAGPAMAADMVKINCADAAALSAGLHNIGDAKAAAIVTHRETAGLFKAVDDLAAVSGVGEKTVEANRDRIDPTQDCAGT